MTTNGNGATTKGYFFEDLAVGMEASYAKKITNDSRIRAVQSAEILIRFQATVMTPGSFPLRRAPHSRFRCESPGGPT